MAKRGRGEGSIYRRTDGRWVAAITVEPGRRKQFYGSTRNEVARKLRAAQQSLDNALPLGDDRLMMRSVLGEWLKAKATTVRPRTHAGYRINVERHLIPELGDTRLNRLTVTDVEELLRSKLDGGLSAPTVRHIHATLRAALERAVRSGLVARNVAKLTSPPRIPFGERPVLSEREARRFLESVEGDRLAALYGVALSLALRKGEILGLTWNDVDLDTGVLQIARTLQRYDGGYHFGEPKSERSRRSLALPGPLVALLRSHRAAQAEERLRLGPAWAGDAWNLVFCREDGLPLDPTGLTRRFQQRLADAGLPRMRFHDLRHSAASFMIAQRVPLRVVMEVLGHSDIGVTANTYGHIQAELTREATTGVAEALWARS